MPSDELVNAFKSASRLAVQANVVCVSVLQIHCIQCLRRRR